MRILIVTDAWAPQVNGVVRTLQSVGAELRHTGHDVHVLSPDRFRSLPCPTYPEIRLALATHRKVGQRIARIDPDALHIAIEGPLGMAARRWCLTRGYRFTTAYHTQFPDYLAKRTRLPANWFWRYIGWFHRPSAAILVSTSTVAGQLRDHGLGQTHLWGRGVDLECFGPGRPFHPAFAGLPRPIMLYVGRVAVEKNIEAFLGGSHPGARVIVGDGPAADGLKRRYPNALFLGSLRAAALASAYASADVLVFPSRTDTFGLVMIEALACGTPVAAYPVPGPVDLLDDRIGAMHDNLDAAVAAALTRDRGLCTEYGRSFSWEASARQFEGALVPLRGSVAEERPAADLVSATAPS